MVAKTVNWCQNGAKGVQNEAKRAQKGAKGEQKGAKRKPKSDQNASKNRSSEKVAKREGPQEVADIHFCTIFDQKC